MMVRIRMSEPFIGKEEINNAAEAVATKMRPNDQFVLDFEKGFSNYIGSKHGISVINGTAALHLALAALGIKSGDEVIVPTMTSIGCTNAIAYTGAKAVFADSTADYWCVDPESIEKKITKKTKAIMPVHIYGHPCDMDPILEIAKKHDLRIVEDAAEAHGAEYKGKRVGNLSDIGCFSFYGNKIVTTAEGGMCLTNDPELSEKMKILRNQGTKPEYRNKYYYDMIGFNYRMTNMQAAVGVAQLKRLDYLVGKKLEMARIYDELFRSRSKNIVRAPNMEWAKNTYWYYSILVPKGMRDAVVARLESREIEVRPFFYPIHMLPHYNTGEKMPVAEDISFRGLNIPSGPYLTNEQIEEVVSEISKITG
jgi:perosamine synthetase